jgi:arsenate reductase (thioredoxin)
MDVKRVLFLCIGNSCRSQMAEGFAARYGSDVMHAVSAGLAPASIVQLRTKKVMEAKNININHQYPKDLAAVDPATFDIIVNMSGRKIPASNRIDIREWRVEDPIGKEEEIYIAVRDQIEMQVMHLILELRRNAKPPEPAKPNKRSLAIPSKD